jgi:anionic cell wall polymer biosynthesis LytR-Cps2A-Psr (LCP) family protein
VAVLDFVAFKGITNALGGVKVNNPTAFNSSQLPGRVFESGEIILDGEEALAFVRERYAFSDGDYQRVRNQQLYLKAVISKAIGSDGLTNPARILDIIQAVVPRLATDEGVTPAYAAGLAFELRGIRNKDVKFFTLPTLGTDRVGGQSIVRVDFAELGKVRLALAAETLDEYASQD